MNLHQFIGQSGSDDSLESKSIKRTLDSENALRRYTSSPLLKSEDWVLKCIQAANATSAPRVQVVQTREQTELSIIGGYQWERRQLLRYLAEGRESDPDWGHILIAIRGLLGVGRPFSVTYPSGETDVWTGTEFSAAPAVKRARKFTITASHYLTGTSRTWYSFVARFKAVNVSLRISSRLTDSGFLSPAKLILDKRVLSPILGIRDRLHENIGVRGEPVVLAAYQFGNLPNHFQMPHSGFPQVFTCGRLDDDFFSVIVVVCKGYSNGSLTWLSDGVIVRDEILECSGSYQVFALASAKGLPTELGGLALRTDSNFVAYRRKVLMRLKGSIRNSLNSMRKPFYLDYREDFDSLAQSLKTWKIR
jgi:hypothetical protein